MSNLIDQADEAHARDRERIATLEADNARLRELLTRALDIQNYSKGYDNGVSDSTGTQQEGDYWAGVLFDEIAKALKEAP